MAADQRMSKYLRKHGPAVDKDLLIEGQAKYIAELEGIVEIIVGDVDVRGLTGNKEVFVKVATIARAQRLLAQGYAD